MSSAGIRRHCAFVLLCLAAPSWLVAAEDLLPDSRRSISRNASFEVIADDMLSARYAAQVGEMLAGRFSRILPLPDRPVQRVLVDLVPASHSSMESPFATRIYPSGQVSVSISWSERTSRANLERALAQGYLTHLAAVYTQGAVTVPLWLELATQHLARAEAVASHGRALGALVTDARPLRLEKILRANRSDGLDEKLGPHAYWLLVFLEQEGRGRGQLKNFLIRLFRGEAPLVALNAAFGERLHSVAEAETWWLVGVNELVRSPGTPLVAMGTAQRRLNELSRLTFRAGDEEVRLFPEDLWEHRKSARLQDELRYRTRTMRLEIVSFHPFYHNALLSLSRLFEAVLAADEAAYREAVVAFHHDRRTGDELVEDTASVLDDLQAELGL